MLHRDKVIVLWLITLSFLCLQKNYSKAQSTLQDSIDLFQWEKYSLQKEIAKIDSILEPLRIKRINRRIESIGTPKMDEFPVIYKMEGYFLSKKSGSTFPNLSMHLISNDLFSKSANTLNSLSEINQPIDSSLLKQLTKNDLKLVPIIPLADVKWSGTILESLNRRINAVPMKEQFYDNVWSELETFIRNYFYKEKHSLVVVTGSIFDKPNEEYSLEANAFYKAIISPSDSLSQGIAFLIPHRYNAQSFKDYSVSIDSLEKITGISFFPNLPDSISTVIKKQESIELWASENDPIITFKPLSKMERPKKTLNTLELENYINFKKRLTVCGTVAGGFITSNGHSILNMDESYPNQKFSITILKDELRNFGYEPLEYLRSKKICASGFLSEYENKPGMFVQHERQIEILP